MVNKTSKGITVYSADKKKKRKTIKQKLKEFIDPETGKRKESSIERKVREWLEEKGIPFKQEKPLQYKGKWKSYDFYISDGVNYSFLLECDGYFHGIDKSGNQIKSLNRIQKRNKKNDKFKDELAKHLGIPLFRLMENDIKNNFNKIESIILDEINRQKEAGE